MRHNVNTLFAKMPVTLLVMLLAPYCAYVVAGDAQASTDVTWSSQCHNAFMREAGSVMLSIPDDEREQLASDRLAACGLVQ